MKKLQTALFLSILFLLFQSCRDNSPIILEAKKTEQSSHLGNGVWIIVPPGFKKAKTYDGFQAEYPTTSVSLQIEDASLAEVKESFSLKKLTLNKTTLLELRPVQFGTTDSAFFAVVHDARKGTIRYLLSVQQGSKTYNIKAFCLKTQENRYDKILRTALFSTYIGEFEEEEKLFKMAGLEQLGSVIFTKDGQYPTTAPDEAKIEVVSIGKNHDYPTQQHQFNFLKYEVAKMTGNSANAFGQEPLTQGSYVTVSGYGPKGYAFTAFIVDPAEMAIMVKCFGKAPGNIAEFEDFVRANFIKAEIIRVR